MSQDLIIFDPTGLDNMSGDRSEIMASIDRYMHENDDPSALDPAPTKPIQAFLDSVTGDYVGAYHSGKGRYCSINQPGPDNDWENTIITFCDYAKINGLILIDPQGNEPIMTTPCGAGLLDF